MTQLKKSNPTELEHSILNRLNKQLTSLGKTQNYKGSLSLNDNNQIALKFKQTNQKKDQLFLSSIKKSQHFFKTAKTVKDVNQQLKLLTNLFPILSHSQPEPLRPKASQEKQTPKASTPAPKETNIKTQAKENPMTSSNQKQKIPPFDFCPQLIKAAQDLVLDANLKVYREKIGPLQASISDISEELLFPTLGKHGPSNFILKLLKLQESDIQNKTTVNSNNVLIDSIFYRVKLTPETLLHNLELIENENFLERLTQLIDSIQSNDQTLRFALKIQSKLAQKMKEISRQIEILIPNLYLNQYFLNERETEFSRFLSYKFDINQELIIFGHRPDERSYPLSNFLQDHWQIERDLFIKEIQDYSNFQRKNAEKAALDEVGYVLTRLVAESPDRSVFDYIDHLTGVLELKNTPYYGLLSHYVQPYLFVRYEKLIESRALKLQSKEINNYTNIFEMEDLLPCFAVTGDYYRAFSNPLEQFPEAKLSLDYLGEHQLDVLIEPSLEKFRHLESINNLETLIFQSRRGFNLLTLLQHTSDTFTIKQAELPALVEYLQNEYSVIHTLLNYDIQVVAKSIAQHIPLEFKPFFEMNSFLEGESQSLFQAITQILTQKENTTLINL